MPPARVPAAKRESPQRFVHSVQDVSIRFAEIESRSRNAQLGYEVRRDTEIRRGQEEQVTSPASSSSDLLTKRLLGYSG